VVEVDRAVCISVHSGTNFIQVCFQNVGNANENLYFVSKSSFFFHLAPWRFIGGFEDIASRGPFMLLALRRVP
jgi:hypothetical protein